MAANNKIECLFGDVARIACEAGRKSANSPKIREYIDSCLVFEFAMLYYGGPPLAEIFGVEEYDALQGFSRIAKTYELRPGYGTEAPAGDGKTIQCGAYASMKGWAAADSMDSMRAAPHLGLSGFSKEADFSSEYGRAEHMGALILRVYVCYQWREDSRCRLFNIRIWRNECGSGFEYSNGNCAVRDEPY